MTPSGRAVYAWPEADGYGQPRILGIADPGPELYVMDESGLSTLIDKVLGFRC